MTGPLAPLFARLHTYIDTDGLVVTTEDAREALASIERHVQDMEKALRDVDRLLTSTGGSLSPRHADHWRAREAVRAALPAREKEEE